MQISNAACYLRLSRDDGDKLESDSISNQRELIKNYVEHNQGLKLVQEYADDGYSGTNFDRPSFKRMMDDIQNGSINCIIVKDLSRLGRNYIETGRYLERIFPFMGVRFISILDNYDSENDTSEASQIIIPFKNLINDSYCRDISNKIRSQLDIKRKTGKFIGSFASYGYLKDPKDKNHLVIDPVAGDIVRKIYEMKMDGYNSQHIADSLNDLGLLPPAEYKRSRGMNFETGFRVKSGAGWTPVSVNRILTKELYTGTMIQGYKRKISYKIKQCRDVPKDEWFKVENTHEALVSKEVFDEVQKLLLYDTRTSPGKEKIHPFSGLIVCGNCHQNMVLRKARKKYNYFICNTNKNGHGCTPHSIKMEKLEQMVLEVIQNQISLFLKANDLLETINRVPEKQSKVKIIEQQLIDLQKEIQRYRTFNVQAYEDFLSGILDKDEFGYMKKSFNEKIDKAEVKLKQLQIQKVEMMSNKNNLKDWVEKLKDYQNIEKLDRSIVVTLVEQIVIHDKEHVTIRMHYQDEMQEVIDTAKEYMKESLS